MSDHIRSDALSDAEQEIMRLRELLLAIYVAVLSHLPDTIPDDQASVLFDTVLAAGEGRPFSPLPLPWPALN